MAEGNKMREMSVNKLMVQMGIPMILSMALQAVYNIVDSAFVGNMEVELVWGLMHFLREPWDREMRKRLQKLQETAYF